MVRPSSRGATIIAGLSCAILQLIASWPGWLSGDSVAMLLSARIDSINDWHSPLLIVAWQSLGDVRLGPVLPLTAQIASTWTGLTLIALRLAFLGWRWAWALLPGFFLLGVVWTSSWVLKDSFTFSVLALALGIATMGRTSTSEVGQRLVLLALGVLSAAALIPRWYMLPVMALIAYSLARMGSSSQGIRPRLAVLAVFVLCVTGLYLVERELVKPEPAYGAGTTMFLDLARVECTQGTPQARAQGVSLFPREFLRTVPGRDICEDFSPYSHDSLFRFSVDSPDTGSYYVLPTQEDEMQRLTSAWVDLWRQHPSQLIGSRIQQAGRFLVAPSSVWWSPSSGIYTDPTASIRGGIGDGQAVGSPSRGGLVLVALATVTQMGTAMLLTLPFGLITILILPAVAWLHLRSAPRTVQAAYRSGLLVPFTYLVAMAVVVPSDDFRYVATASLWGVAVSLLALAECRNARPVCGTTQYTTGRVDLRDATLG